MTEASTESDARFFDSPEELRAWFDRNHDQLDEQWIGFYKKDSGVASITWPESVDEALCFGWIDGLRKSIDDKRYMIRFTPRRRGSHWSAKNLARVEELRAAGRMQEAGIEVYDQRDRQREAQASYEQGKVSLPPEYDARLRESQAALDYWRSAPPSYRKQVSWWIVSAKQEKTRLRRLQVLIDSSAAGDVVPPLRWTQKK